MSRFSRFVAFFVLLTCAAAASAADRQHPVDRASRSNGKADMKSRISTYNIGTESKEAHALSSQGYRIENTIYISGQYSHGPEGVVVHEGDFAGQTRKTLQNIDLMLAGFHVKRSNIAELVVYLTNPSEQAGPVTPLLVEYLGEHRPALTVIGVTGLFYPQQLIEIRVVAHTD